MGTDRQVGSVTKTLLNRFGFLLPVVFALLAAFPVFQQNLNNYLLLQQPTDKLEHLSIDFSALSIAELRLISAQLLDGRRYTETLAAIEHIPLDDHVEFDTYRQVQAMAMVGKIDEAIYLGGNLQISTDTLVELATANWNVLGGEDRLPLARLWFTIASDRNDGNWVSRRALGAWWRWFEPARAVPYLESVVEEQPDDAFTHYLLGLTYRDVGMLDLGIKHVEQGLHLTSFSAPNYCMDLARLYITRNQPGDKDFAYDVIEQCLQRMPENASLQQFAAEIGAK